MTLRHRPAHRSRLAAALLAPLLAFGALAGCGSDDVPDEGTKGEDAVNPNPTTGGVTE